MNEGIKTICWSEGSPLSHVSLTAWIVRDIEWLPPSSYVVSVNALYTEQYDL